MNRRERFGYSGSQVVELRATNEMNKQIKPVQWLSHTRQIQQVSYTSNANFVGADSFTFKVNDGMADSAIATVTINVAEEVTSTTGGGKIFLPVVEQ